MDGQDGQDLITEGGHSCMPRREAGPPRNDGEISRRFIVIVIVMERKGGKVEWWSNGVMEWCVIVIRPVVRNAGRGAMTRCFS